MVGVDTNILVRLLTRDDEAQFKKARSLFAKNEILVSLTVLLETEWVLRYAYKFSPDQIADAFEALGGQGNVVLSAPRVLARGIQGIRKGMDFADALHLAQASGQASHFVTFDQKLAARAFRDDCPVRLLT
jgi:predicted nucleic-acid-binding protein